MSAPALTVPVPDFPVIGNNIPVAVMFVLHIAVAEYSAGAIAIAPFMELRGVRRNDPRALRYARSITNSYYLVFSLGATLAVFAVVLLIGLWGREFGDLVNAFLPLVGVLFGLFLILAPLLVLYRNTFDQAAAAPRLHVALGFIVAVLQNAFVVGITMVDAYLITPSHAGFLDGARNPPYLALVLHRLMGNVSWTALFLAGFAVIRLARARGEGDRLFQAWAARVNLRIGLLIGALMPLGGFFLVETLRTGQHGFFFNLTQGQAAWLFSVQAALLGAVLIGGNVALTLEMPRRRGGDVVGRGAVLLCAAGSVLGVLPAQVLGIDLFWVRYLGIGAAAATTLLHLAYRSVPERTMPRLAMSPAPGAAGVLPFSASAAGRRALVMVGVVSAALALFMGYLKEEARGDYSFYGELTQAQGHGHFNPDPGLFP